MIWQVGKMKKNVQLVVGEFPSFGDSQTRAIGTPDEGKTSWAVGDELLITSSLLTILILYTDRCVKPLRQQ